jgi:signal transduction histidine kinase
MQNNIINTSLRACYKFLTFQTLGARFFWIIVSTSLLSAVLYGLVVAKVWGQFVDTSAQKVNRNLASELVNLIQVDNAAHTLEDAKRALAKVRELFPGFDLYLYSDSKRRLISSTKTVEARINIAPLEKFLSSDGIFNRPITLPSEPFHSLQQSETYPFSTAKIELDNEQYYLIALLGGSRHVAARAASSKRHLKVFSFYLLASVIFTGCTLVLLVLVLLPSRLRRMSMILAEFRKGDYSRRIKDTSSDELGVYARSFDEMAEALETTMRHLTSQDKLRRALVADVSHELRRPLTVLNLSLETLIEDNDSNSKDERMLHLRQALSCGENLSRKISDLFSLSKLEARIEPPQLSQVYATDLLSEVSNNLEALMKEKEITVILDLHAQSSLVLCDEVLLEQALSNLLENAIKHSEHGSSITLSAKAERQGTRIAVQDYGSGIPAIEQPDIFRRFFKGSTAHPEGGGLGLAIAKRIIELHDSTLEVKSGVGEGSIFSFCLRPSP